MNEMAPLKMTFTIAETSRMFAVSDDHIRRMIKRRMLRVVDFSLKSRSKRKDLRILKSSIDAFIASRMSRTG